MSVTKIGINFTNFGNVTAPDFNISNTTSGFIQSIPVRANEYTHNWLGVFIPIGMFIFIYYVISDRSAIGQFGYSYLRGFAISSGIVGIVTMFMVALGWFTSVYMVVVFLTLFMLGFIFTMKEER